MVITLARHYANCHFLCDEQITYGMDSLALSLIVSFHVLHGFNSMFMICDAGDAQIDVRCKLLSGCGACSKQKVYLQTLISVVMNDRTLLSARSRVCT